MKKVKVSLSILCFLSALLVPSCQKAIENEGVREDVLKSIAEDPDYVDYRQKANIASYHVATSAWDRIALRELMEKYPNQESHCTFPDNELAAIRGGLLWKETYCAVYSSRKKVRNKFKALHLDTDSWEKILDYYMESKGKKEIEAMGETILSNK